MVEKKLKIYCFNFSLLNDQLYQVSCNNRIYEEYNLTFIKLYIVYEFLDTFLHPFIITFIHYHQVHLNLHLLMTFELTNIYVHVSINRSIVKRI
jgi:uncharacterized membrane protein (DUF485 family)